MKYPHDTRRVTGILIPLAALRSQHSIGCGEFADLPELARWCASAGLTLIQLLPVNDTGSESSPYSALSAYALHPLYLRITDLPEIDHISLQLRNSLDVAMRKLRHDQDDAARFDYQEVLIGKVNLLRTIYEERRETICNSEELAEFVTDNSWVRAYSVFRALKDRNHQRAWSQWDTHRDIESSVIQDLWDDGSLRSACRYYAWLQLRLAQQFRAASDGVAAEGIALKGDIPILMNEDSVDAWFNRDVFRPNLRAGAPPDMFSDLGQNWGFPIYNWKHLEQNDFEWWRERLRQAARYYHAYRIDHVLGFFRIWAIPAGNYSGILGFFWPQSGISREMLQEIGFDEGRIRWLAQPHIGGEEARAVCGAAFPTLEETVLKRIADQDLFLFADSITGESSITNADLPTLTDAHREWLLAQFRDRALVEMPDGTFAPTWTFRECSRYQALHQEEQDRFERLVAREGSNSNDLWAEHGRHLLSFMRKTTDMLTCAEDLGVVPEAVPRILGELDVLSLRIPRWSHYWDQPGQPLIPLDEYPEASVCAPSVHDTSTMRDWWQNEDGREQLWETLGFSGPCPISFDPAIARATYRAFAACNSRILVFQLQDLLALTPELIHADPTEERINIPGTSNRFNWTWRMPATIEALQDHPVLTREVRALAESRHPGKESP